MTGIIFFCFIALAMPALVRADTATPDEIKPAEVKILPLDLQVDIPGLKPEDLTVIGSSDNPECGEGLICAYTIGAYANAFYTWAAAAAVTFAIVLIMIGGAQYAVGAATGSTEPGLKRMRNAAMGLILVLGVSAILGFVNPQILTFVPLKLEVVDPVAYVATSLDISFSDASSGGLITIPPGGVPAFAGTGKGAQREDFEKMGVYCPGSGGSAEVRKVAESFIGKVNYRLGGKLGLTAPYRWELPPKKVPARRSPQGDIYGYFCPDDSFCLDCSGFTQVVSECAGLASRNESGGTGQIFQNAPRITSCNDDTVNLEDGSERALEPGDYVGFAQQGTQNVYRHVWVYIGNGQLANSSGSGRSGNRGANIRTLDWACANYPLYLRAVGT